MSAPAPLRLGSTAPNFQAETTKGNIDFHEFIGDNWVILFSHPEDYTPVCTTELGAFAKLQPEFTKRNVKLIGLSANTIQSHEGWIKDIGEVTGGNVEFPIIGDKERKVSLLYDMIDQQDATNVDEKGIAFTIRSVFIIDPKKTIRTIFSYPASTGRNAAEVLRVIDSSRPVTSTASPPLSTGSLVRTSSSTPPSRTRRPRLCSPSSASSSLTSDSPLSLRRRFSPSKLIIQRIQQKSMRIL
ncbi:hypothetical protein NXS19_012713 [Fusarium pseudograminearum]|nr:hypothetical protein NXS19_012713 [Fusarium pseudograminearum]